MSSGYSAEANLARRNTMAGIMYALLATFLWSIVPVGIKYLLHQSVNPFTIACSRFILASSCLWLISKARPNNVPPSRRDLPLLMLGGVGMAGNYTLYAVGLQHTTASATNIIVQDEVVALVILSHFLLGERLGIVKITGMLAAIAGIAIVFLTGQRGVQSREALTSSQQLLGNIIIFFAGLSWPMYGIAQKLLSKRAVSNTNALAYIFAFSALISIGPGISGLRSQVQLTPAVFFWLFVVGVISTGIGYLCLARAFDLMSASTVAVITCMLPIFTLLMAGIFLGETLTPSIALGALFVVAGITVIGREEAAGSRAAKPNADSPPPMPLD